MTGTVDPKPETTIDEIGVRDIALKAAMFIAANSGGSVNTAYVLASASTIEEYLRNGTGPGTGSGAK